jgi:arylsulfatase
MRIWLLPFIGLFVVSGCGEAPKPIAPPSARPNIVLIVMDTLRADRIDARRKGKPVMPFLSRMAEEGEYFRNAISPSSWTKPALASVLTGVYSNRHGVRHSARIEDPEHPTSDVLDDSWTTLAEWLVAQGYTPWAFQTNANLTRALGFAQGYEERQYHFSNGAPASEVTRAALESFPQLPAPFFLYAHYMDPHAPYRPVPELAEALGAEPIMNELDRAILDSDGRFMDYYLDQVKTAIGLQSDNTMPELSSGAQEAVRHRYDLECLAMDRAIEKLVTAIREKHPDTVFVFLSDHGEEFWERGGMGHGVTLFQEQVRVPLIILDGDTPGRVREEMVSTMAILPWLAKRLGVPPLESWNQVDNGAVFSETWGPWPSLSVHHSAVFMEGHSLIRNHATNKTELFSLERDPEEWADVSVSDRERAASMGKVLDAYLAESAKVESATVPLAPGEVEVLEAIGYGDSGH